MPLPLEEPGEALLISASRKAMAGEFEIDLNAGQYPQGTERALDALDEITRLEEKLSFFRPNSMVSYLNAVAAAEPVAIDDELFQLLDACLELWHATNGAFDVTATPLWETWGFARRDGRLPSEAEIAAARESVGCDALKIDKSAQTVRFLKPGLRLNFGAAGKGYALDMAARSLRDGGIDDFLMHGGLSSVLACGTQKNDSGTAGWRVGVAHPMRRGQRLRELRLIDRAVGTSGTQQQFFHHRGKRYGHILDPRTGWPADKLLGVTVLAPSALLADALSTAFFVMGPEAALAYCAAHEEIAALLTVPVRRGCGYEILEAGEIP